MLDAYELRARLSPGALSVLPVVVALAALGVRDSPVVTTAIALTTLAGGAYVLAVVVGHAGRRVQPRLWDSWGGPPTQRLLRLREPSENSQQVDVWRAGVTAYSGVPLLDAAAEASDPTAADQAIETAIGQCRQLGHGGTEGKTLAQAENAQYGFERNLFGFRWFGRSIAVGGSLVVGGLLVGTELPATPLKVGLVLELAMLVIWLLLPSAERTRAAADRYARQLLDAVVIESRRS